MLDASSTHIHKLEQASAAFRDAAEVLAELRIQLINHGFTEEGAESICETAFVMGMGE